MLLTVVLQSQERPPTAGSVCPSAAVARVAPVAALWEQPQRDVEVTPGKVLEYRQ